MDDQKRKRGRPRKELPPPAMKYGRDYRWVRYELPPYRHIDASQDKGIKERYD